MSRLSWICALLFGAAWLLPLHVLPWMSWHNEVLAFVAVLVAAAVGLAWSRPRPAAIAVPGIALLPVLVAAVAVVQFVAGRIVHGGNVLAIASYALLCVAAAAAGRAAAGAAHDQAVPALRIFALALVATALVQLLVVWGQTFSPWNGSDWIATTAYLTRGGGNVAQPNQAAFLFVSAMAAAWYLRARGELGAPAAAVLLLALAGGLATTQSRSGLLGLAVLAAWCVLRLRPARSSRTWSALALAAVAVGLFALWPAVMDVYWQTDAEEVNLTSSGRTAMWSQFLSAVWMRPWMGWGVMQVAEAQNAVAHRYPAVMAATFAHNVFLDLALWLGVPGMLLIVGLAAAWAWPRVRAARTPDAWFCVALAVPFAVQSLTEFPYAYAYILAPVMFALGVLDAKTAPAPAWRLPRPVAVPVLALWIAGTAWSAIEYVRIEEDFRIARFEALRVGQTPAAYEAPRTHLLTQLDALLRATRVKAEPGMRPEDLALLRDVAMLHPWGATNFRYATALALNGQLEEAARQLQVLRALQGQKTYESLMKVLDEMAVEHPVLKQLRQP